jgi:uncharacterized protein with PIN domain
MMGYDSLFFDGHDDDQLLALAQAEDRVILTRDTGIMKRRIIKSEQLKAVLIDSDKPEQQMQQLIATLHLKRYVKPFTLCLECNQPLVERHREEVKDRVPPYVYKTQRQYMECPNCRRIYWRGTHWQAMTRTLEELPDWQTMPEI